MREQLKIVTCPLELNQSHLFYCLKNFVNNSDLYLKLEGINPAGSIKIKPAIKMLEELEKQGLINAKQHSIIESSSGNLGIALSIACHRKGYRFTCISDPNINDSSQKYIKLYGAELIIVTDRDENGGFLNTRIRLIESKLKTDPNLIWLNQYTSINNIAAHSSKTAVEIFNSLGSVDYLFVGAGTTGTLMGCANYIKQNSLHTKLIAIDVIGSVTFGSPSAKRFIPGLGTSRKPEIADPEMVDDILMISEADTIKMCRQILKIETLLIGGSTGTVLAGVKQYGDRLPPSASIAAISPDFGDRYIDTIYNDKWVKDRFPQLL